MSHLVKGKKSGVDNTSRRTWDKDEFRKKAEEKDKAAEAEDAEELSAYDIRKRKRLERDPLHQGLIVARSHLQQRGYEVDLASRLGKTQVVGFNTPLNQQAGWFCSVCDCVLRDSQSYLDHINGKWHNRALGMTMRVEKSTVEQVKNKFEELKTKKDGKPGDYVPDGFETVAAAEAREREEKRARKKKDEEGAADEGGEADPDMMALMGFGGFGGGKKS